MSHKNRLGFWSRVSGAALLMATFALAGCSASSMGSNVASGPQPVALLDTYQAAAAGVKIRWFRQPALYNDGTSELTDVWRVGDSVYLSSNDYRLVSLDADTGKTNWKTNLGYVPHVLKPADWTDYLICMSRTTILLIDRRNGKVINRNILDFACTSPPVVIGDNVMVGTGADFFKGLYIDLLGKQKFSVHSEAGDDSFISAPVVVGGRRIACASRKGYLWCIDPDLGAVLWSYRKVTGNVVGGLGSDSRNIYVPSMDNKVFAFDSVDSGYLWDTHLEGRLDQTLVAIKGDRLLVPSTGKGLYCLETDKGLPQWCAPDIVKIISRSATTAYCLGTDGDIKAVRLSDGKIVKSFAIPNVKNYAINQQGPTIYAAAADGRIMAIEPEPMDLVNP